METLTGASKEAGLEINVVKTKYMLLSYQQNTEQNHHMTIAYIPFENVAGPKYMGLVLYPSGVFCSLDWIKCAPMPHSMQAFLCYNFQIASRSIS
jgi:hypothetical protein